MLYSPTIISIVEVLIATVPVLLTVAFVTVAERKTMASMQRRIGPNIVGQTKKFSHFKPQVRFYHSTRYDKAMEVLYKNRIAPLKPFEENVICVCKDLLSPTALNTFFKNLQGKSGIYMFTLKNNPCIFYIGRAIDLEKRFKSHLNPNLKDRFHVFANTIGWKKFEFSIIEIGNINMQKKRENLYLHKYLPLLNTIFISNLTTIQTHDCLHEILKLKQLRSNFENKYIGINIHVYEYLNKKINTSCKTFNSIYELSSYLGVS